MEIEVMAYRAASARGDVFPVCMRLTAARAEAEWSLRSALVRECGPATPQASLDRACEYMPDAPEPRLLRAARSMAIAERTAFASIRRDWLAFAHRDLVDVLRIDAMDATARALLAELVGAHAWAMPTCIAPCMAA